MSDIIMYGISGLRRLININEMNNINAIEPLK